MRRLPSGEQLVQAFRQLGFTIAERTTACVVVHRGRAAVVVPMVERLTACQWRALLRAARVRAAEVWCATHGAAELPPISTVRPRVA